MTWTLLLWIAALASVSELRLAHAIPPPRLLDCTSQIRLLYPHLFTHCTTACQYSEWSDWEMVAGSNANVTTAQCPSGEAYTETRNRSTSAFAYQMLGCTNTTQSRQICMPDQIDLIIMTLGLGNVGNMIDSVWNTAVNPVRGKRSSQYCASQRVCHSHEERSSKRETPQEAVQHHTPKSSPSLSVSEEAPLPFDWNQHHHRFRRQATCGDQDTQYILFLLDTSGSIGSADFHRMTRELSRLNKFYCRAIQVAVMTFDQTFHVEFCFNCYDNTCAGRLAASEAMANIQYRGRLTHTGGATRCACDFLLSQSCGLPTDAKCISVVYITDGQSNGPHSVCDEVRCLHSHSQVETFAIGIGNYNQYELNCIANVTGDTSIFAGKTFEYNNFDDFITELNAVENRLLESALLAASENNYKCINPTNPFGQGGTSCLEPTRDKRATNRLITQH